MAIIKAPNKEYTGYSASVFFVNGEGETDDPKLIEWFKEKGYTVIEDGKEVNEKEEKTDEEAAENEGNSDEETAETSDEDEKDLSKLTNDELKALLDEKGIEYNNRANKETLIKLLTE